MLLWFLGNRPGFFTFDSFDVWRQATTGQWEDTHPIAYVLAMKISEIVVGTASLLTVRADAVRGGGSGAAVPRARSGGM